MKRLLVSVLLCGAVLLGSRAEARPAAVVRLASVRVVPRRPPVCGVKCKLAKHVAIWSAEKAFALLLAM